MEELTRQEFYSRVLSNIRFSQILNIAVIFVAIFLSNYSSNIIPVTIFTILFLICIISLVRIEFDIKIKNIYHVFTMIARAMLIGDLFILSNYNLSILIVCVTIWISTYPISIFNHCRYFRNRNDIRVYNRMRICIALFILIACIVQVFSKIYMSPFYLTICTLWYIDIILYIYQYPLEKFNTNKLIDISEGCTSLIWNIMNLIFR